MQDWPTVVVVSGSGLWQDGQPLPTNVPGIDSGSSPAQGQDGTGGQGSSPTQQPNGFGSLMFPMLLLVLVFMIVTTMMSSRREKRRVSDMLAGLKRGDRVQTVAGVIGTVHEVKDDSVVLRVDESTGTKISFARSSVQHVLKSARSDSKAEDPETED